MLPQSKLSDLHPVMRRHPSVRAALIVLATTAVASCMNLFSGQFRSPDSEVPGIFYDNPSIFTVELREAIRPAPTTAITLTKSQERFRMSPYNDPVQFCTVAYGHLIVKNPCGPQEYDQYPIPLTEAQGTELLEHDMQLAEIIVGRGVKLELTDGQYGALCDFTFNVGARNFLHSRLLKLVNSDSLDQIPAEFRRWRRAGSTVLAGLVKRRELEIALFFEGVETPRELVPQESTRPDIDIYSGRNIRGD
jgi:lysozyme